MKRFVLRVLSSNYFRIPAAVLVLYAIVGFVALPFAIRWYLPKVSVERTKCRAEVGKLRINPFLLTVNAANFSLTDPEGVSLAAFDRLYVNFDIGNPFRRAIVVRTFSIDNPTANIVIEPDGSINAAGLTGGGSKPETPEDKGPSTPPRLILDNFSLTGGKLTLTDRRAGTPATVVFQDLSIQLKGISTFQDRNGSYSFSAATPNGETLQWRGEMSLAPFRSSGHFDIGGVYTKTLWEFARNNLNLEAPDGRMDLATDYRFDLSEPAPQLVLENLKFGLTGLSLKLAGAQEPFFDLGTFSIESVRFDLASRKIGVGKILADGGSLRAAIGKSGSINLLQAVKAAPAKIEKEKEKENPPPAAPGAAESPAPAETSPPAESSTSPKLSTPAKTSSPGDGAAPAREAAPAEGSVSTKPSAPVEGSPPAKAPAAAESSAPAKDPPPAESSTSPKVSTPAKTSSPGDGAAPAKEAAPAEGPVSTKPSTPVEAPTPAKAPAAAESSAPAGSSASAESPAPDKESAPAESSAPAEGAVPSEGSAPAEASTPVPPWTVDVDAVDIKNIALAFQDLSRGSPMKASVASLSVSFTARIEAGTQKKVLIQHLGTQLGGVHLSAGDLPLLEAAGIDIQDGELDLFGQRITIARIRLNDGRFDATRDKDGRMGFERLVPPRDETAAKPAAASGPPWQYLVKDFEISNFRSDLRDLSVSEAPLYRIDGLNVRVSGIDGKSPMDFEAGFGLEKKGKASFKGRVDPSGMSVEAAIDVSALPLAPLQPYVASFADAELRSGALSTRGKFRYGVPGAGARLAYEGSFELDKLRLYQPKAKEPELGWDALKIPQLALNIEPNSLQIKEIKLSKPVGHVIIAKDKTLNLAKMIKEQPARSQPPASKKENGGGFPFSIGRVLIDNGDIVFADFSLQPKFMARIHDLKGQIGKLSSESTQAATVRLAGGVDRYGSVKVEGSIVPGDYKRSTELTLAFRNVAMASITPYSGKFAGRAIKSGRLTLDLKYKIRDSKMEGDNKIIVQNLVLGEHVNSPDAVNLPLDIAVALLTDSKGRIELGLPVSGDLDNPQFSIAPLVWKAFKAVLTKVATAPFRALGALFGGGKGAGAEDIQVVAFEAGSAELVPPEKEKLAKVAAALDKRPQLALAVQGRYTPDSDAMELKQEAVAQAVHAELGTEEKTPSSPLDFSNSKTARAIQKLYVEKFGKPSLEELEQAVRNGKIKPREELAQDMNPKGRKASVFSKMASAVKLDRVVTGLRSPQKWAALSSEMFWRLVEGSPYPEQELVQLAKDRERAVASELLTAGLKDESRLRSKPPQAVEPNKEPSARLFLEAK